MTEERTSRMVQGSDLVQVPDVRLDGVERGVVRLAVRRTEPYLPP